MSISNRRTEMGRGKGRTARRGFALFLALLVLLVLTISGIALMFNTSVEQSLASTETKISKTFYAADSGLEFAAERIRTDVSYLGGPMPVAMSANYSTSTTPDINVVVSQPVMVGYTVHPGDQYGASGSQYAKQQTVEKFFHLTSTATSTSIQSSKTITADVSIYPLQLTIPPPTPTP